MMHLPSDLVLFWAKLGRETWPVKYHPLICHLIDVGVVARELWASTIRPIVKDAVANQLGLSEAETESWIAFWIATHDIGKLTPCFQYQGLTDQLKMRLTDLGFDAGCGEKHHTETGTNVIHDALIKGESGAWPAIDRGIAHKIAVAIGGHHGIFPTNWHDLAITLGNNRWSAARQEMLTKLAQLFHIPSKSPGLASSDDQSVWMFLAGLTSVADWIGSNVSFFPAFVHEQSRFDDPLDVSDYFERATKQARCSLNELGWLGRSDPTNDVRSFREATGIETPRPLQEAIVTIAGEMKTPRLVIVEAPMGEGKTEAAWYVADCWDRLGGAGTYIALPTMATSNQMFERVEQFLARDGVRQHLQLLHGKATLNPNFERLRYFARVYDSDGLASGVVAEEWFAKNKKQALLAPFGVGTIDQVLLAVLQTKHVFVRLFGLAGKCVILDEVHAYDAYMTTLMGRLLRWLAALGCPVVLLSATLPKAKRLELMRAYTGNAELEIADDTTYPRVTTVAIDGTPSVRSVEADPTRRKTVHLGWLSEDALVERLKESLKDGGCAAVIRNTVGLAQQTFLALRSAFAGTGVSVELFHARFPFGRRQEIETAVLKKFGKGEDGRPTNPLRPERAILVATQVIEQSLDLDFDVMVSDVAPVDLVLQRGGRLHRHDRGERAFGVREPRMWLIAPGVKDDGRPDFGCYESKKGKGIYERFVLLRTLIALKEKQTVELPGDLESLVEQIYGHKPLDIRQEDVADLAASEDEMRQAMEDSTLNAMGVSIGAPNEDPLHEQNAMLQEDDPEAHKRIQAATRETEPTVQLVLIYQRDGRDFLDPDGKEPFDQNETPSPTRLQRLLDNEVTISNKGCVFYYAKQPVPPGWKRSGMLRYHRIVRLDPDGKPLAGEYGVSYDSKLGVEINPI